MLAGIAELSAALHLVLEAAWLHNVQHQLLCKYMQPDGEYTLPSNEHDDTINGVCPRDRRREASNFEPKIMKLIARAKYTYECV